MPTETCVRTALSNFENGITNGEGLALETTEKMKGESTKMHQFCSNNT
jgi:hypothetical protein